MYFSTKCLLTVGKDISECCTMFVSKLRFQEWQSLERIFTKIEFFEIKNKVLLKSHWNFILRVSVSEV